MPVKDVSILTYMNVRKRHDAKVPHITENRSLKLDTFDMPQQLKHVL